MRSGDAPSPDRLSLFSALSDYIKEQRDMQETVDEYEPNNMANIFQLLCYHFPSYQTGERGHSRY